VSQELAQGSTIAQRFAGLAYTACPTTRCHPRRVFGFILGLPNSGKTRFFCSCDGAYIINLDQSSAPVSDPSQMKAGMWPYMDAEGVPRDADGSKVILSWDAVLQKVQKLKQLAVDDKPRPDVIIFDSISAYIDLGMQYVTQRGGKTDFKELHGPAAWDDVYGNFVRTCVDLRRLGYGVYITGHCIYDVIPMGEHQYTEKVGLTITDNFWKRIHHRLELSFLLKTEFYNEDLEQKLSGGKVRKLEGRGARRSRHIVTCNDEKFAGLLKGRVDFPEMILPSENAWDVFEKAYMNEETE